MGIEGFLMEFDIGFGVVGIKGAIWLLRIENPYIYNTEMI